MRTTAASVIVRAGIVVWGCAAGVPVGAQTQVRGDQNAVAIIRRVRSETLTVAGKGRSSVSLGSAVAYNGYTNHFNLHTWSAVEAPPGQWTVTVRGKGAKGSPDMAQWSYDAATSEVKPLDEFAVSLGFRRVYELSCLTEAVAKGAIAVRKAQVAQLVILPLPAPEHVKPYTLNAEFFVNAYGAGTLLEWNEPNEPTFARKVFDTLRGYRFRPALAADGTPTCATTVIRASIGMDPRRREE